MFWESLGGIGAYFGIFYAYLGVLVPAFAGFGSVLRFLLLLLPFPCAIPEFCGPQIPNFPAGVAEPPREGGEHRGAAAAGGLVRGLLPLPAG